MNKLYSKSGNILTEQKDIIQESRNHYKSLYTCRTGNLFNPNMFFENDNVNKLSEDDKNSLEGKLTYEEMLSALKKMRNNSAPGNSGFTVSFYKFFWTDIGHFIVRSLNYAFESGELSVTQKQGVITCIPKGNKDKLLLKYWRPISLLNVSYKMASAAIAARSKTVLTSLINEDQTGCLPGRFIGDNIRLV